MHRYYQIFTGILFILSIVDFALAAPVLAQEKRQARTNVVRIPNDVINVLGKRWDEELEKLGMEFFKTSGKPTETPSAHSLSGSVPSGSDHRSTNVVQPPVPVPVLSTANPDPLMDPSCSPVSSSMQGLRARGGCWSFLKLLNDESAFKGLDPLQKGMFTATLQDYGTDQWHELTATGGHAPKLNPNPSTSPLIDPSADPNFDWETWIYADDPPLSSTPPRPSTPEVPPTIKEEGQALGYAPSPPLTESHLYPGSEMHLPLPVAGPSEDQSPEEIQAAIYAAKGKAKETRRSSDTDGDVGNAAQRELQPS